jgi:hypothetical protein
MCRMQGNNSFLCWKNSWFLVEAKNKITWKKHAVIAWVAQWLVVGPLLSSALIIILSKQIQTWHVVMGAHSITDRQSCCSVTMWSKGCGMLGGKTLSIWLGLAQVGPKCGGACFSILAILFGSLKRLFQLFSAYKTCACWVRLFYKK